MNKRLHALDGLRGLAILTVFINHVPLVIFYTSLPSNFHSLLQILFGSGGVGVYIFFILSGFLMGWLYPYPNNKLTFLSKRYARLFPPFLVMVTAVTAIKLIGKLPFAIEILIVILSAAVARIIWEMYLKVAEKYRLGKWVFLFWFSFQILVGLWYWLYLLRIPPAVFYQIWDQKIQTIITGVVNATLTLPFGYYIAQLDGVYWTLASEVLFYLLYPVLIIPLIWGIKQISPFKNKTLLYIAFIPFCFGIYLISQRLLGFEILKFHMVIYFITGVILGLNTSLVKKSLTPFLPILSHPLWFVFIILIVFGHHLIYQILPEHLDPWVQILTVFPVSILLLTAILENTFSNIFFANPILTFLGKYSYSLYLTHSFVINRVKQFIDPSSITSAILLTAVSFIIAIILSVILYTLIEKPYFDLRKKRKKIKSKSYALIPTTKFTFNIQTVTRPAIIFTLVMFILLYAAYKPPLAFFTSSFRHQPGKQNVTLTETPSRISFTAADNNLGMITSHIKNQKVEGVVGGFVPSQLSIRLLNSQNNLIAQSTYNAYEIIDSRYHPLGFPLQTNSKGKRYTIEYQLDETSPSAEILLVNPEGYLSVYFQDRRILFSHPTNIFNWLMLKLTEPFTNPFYWLTFIYLYPFLFIIVKYLFPRRH